jgi:hypothetical protein
MQGSEKLAEMTQEEVNVEGIMICDVGIISCAHKVQDTQENGFCHINASDIQGRKEPHQRSSSAKSERSSWACECFLRNCPNKVLDHRQWQNPYCSRKADKCAGRPA